VLAGHPLDHLVVLGARRPVHIAVDPFGVVLRLAVDQHRAAAGDCEEEVDAGLLEGEAHCLVVDRLDLGPAQLGDGSLGDVVAGVQLIGVDDVGGGHRAEAEMPLGLGVEVEGPLGEIVVDLPPRRQAVAAVIASQCIISHQSTERGEQ
jgi:hypothetical protein